MLKRFSQLLGQAPKYILILTAILALAFILSLIWPELRPQFIEIEPSGSHLQLVTNGGGSESISLEGRETDLESETSRVLFPVYLTGAVKQSDVYYFYDGQILADAIVLAGGFRDDAAVDAVNLAMPLSSNQMIRIPSISEIEEMPGSFNFDSISVSSAPDKNDGLININTATVAELCELPGIGASTAAAIIAWRETEGIFAKIEDIMLVSGIKEARFNQIKDRICV